MEVKYVKLRYWTADGAEELRADVRKNQTLAGNSQKIDFAHTFKFDTLSC